MVARLTNQPKTVTDEEDATMNAKQPIREGTATVYSGTPALEHFLKIWGAWPSRARE